MLLIIQIIIGTINKVNYEITKLVKKIDNI